MIAIIYSSLTGNTEKVAKELKRRITEIDAIYKVEETNNLDLSKYDTLIVCYWNNRGTADLKTQDLLNKLENKKIIAVGTLGAYDDGDHCMKMKERVKALVLENNQFIGDFACRGKIEESRTERRIKEGKLDEEGIKRHLSSRLHPNEQDFCNAEIKVRHLLGL